MSDVSNMENWVNRGTKTRVWFLPDPAKPTSAVDRLVRQDEGFTITKEERRFNENKFGRKPENNPFTNGTFTIAAEIGDPDAALHNTSPNAYSDEELLELMKSQWQTLQGALDEITNPVTVRRMIQLGVDHDLSAKAVGRAEKRLAELEPEAEHVPDTAFDPTADDINDEGA